MTTLSRRGAVIGSLALLGATAANPANADWDSPAVADVEGLEGFWDAVEAYIYGYSLVTMEMTAGS